MYAIQDRANVSDGIKTETATIAPETAMSDWRTWFIKRSHGLLPVDKRCELLANEYNEIVAVRENIRFDHTISPEMRAYLEQFITPPGFVAVRRLDGPIRAIPLWPSTLSQSAISIGKPLKRHPDSDLGEIAEDGVSSKNPSKVKYRLKRGQHIKNGYNFCLCDGMYDKSSSL